MYPTQLHYIKTRGEISHSPIHALTDTDSCTVSFLSPVSLVSQQAVICEKLFSAQWVPNTTTAASPKEGRRCRMGELYGRARALGRSYLAAFT